MIELIALIWLTCSVSAALVLLFVVHKFGYDFVSSHVMEGINDFSFQTALITMVILAPILLIGILVYKLVTK